MFIAVEVWEHSEPNEHRIEFSSIIPIAYLAAFVPPNNHNTARTVPWQVLLGSSPPLSRSFRVVFFIWR